MDFLTGLAAYLFLGGIVAYYAKTVKGEHIWEAEDGEYRFLGAAISWPIFLGVIVGVWLTGGYQKEKG